jgi:hypothetical protein
MERGGINEVGRAQLLDTTQPLNLRRVHHAHLFGGEGQIAMNGIANEYRTGHEGGHLSPSGSMLQGKFLRSPSVCKLERVSSFYVTIWQISSKVSRPGLFYGMNNSTSRMTGDTEIVLFSERERASEIMMEER